MNNLTYFLGGAAFGACLTFAFTLPAHSVEQSECFSLKELQTSFAVVLPKADHVILEGDSAHAYLEEFNSIGEQTDYEGEKLFLSILPTGVVMMIPIKDGLGCRRRVVHPKLHKHIMTKIKRGAV